MSRPVRSLKTVKSIILATTALLGSSPAWATSITADGKLDSSYQLGFTIPFLDDKGNSIGDGQLYFGLDSGGNEFLYFQLPTNYVDNTYGTQAAFDWSGGHTFDQLYGSDKWGVLDKKSSAGGFEWNGNSVTFDYIAGVPGSCITYDKKNNCTKYSISDYRSGGVGTALTDGATDKNDGAINAGSAGSIVEIATSLEYDFDQYGTTYLADSPAMTSNVSGNISYASAVAPNWIYSVGYEIEFAAGTFNSADWLDPAKATSLITLGVVHASPSKTNYSTYGTPECFKGCTDVPEPGTLFLFGAGLGALGWARRRRRPPRANTA